MDEDGTIERVRKWLADSGYALELRVATAMRAAGGGVIQSVPYTDLSTQKVREADLIHHREATMGDGTLARLLSVVECKSSKRSPWVVFDQPVGQQVGSPSEQALFHSPDSAVLERLNAFWVFDDLFNHPRFGNAIVSADGKDDDPNAINPANRAVRQVLSAAYGVRDLYRSTPGATVLLPVIATSAPLVTCHLAAGATDIDIQPTEYAQVRAVHEGTTRAVVVHVMSERYVANDFCYATERLMELAAEEI